MKIVVVDTTVHGSLIGGGHLIATELLKGFRERDHEVHFVSAGRPNEIIRDKIAAAGARTHERLWPSGSLVYDATPVFAAWLNALRPDVHLISTSGDLGWTVLPLLDPRIATLTIGHNDVNTYYSPLTHYWKFVTRAIGVSEEICRRYVDECGMPKERVEWIPYGVEVLDREPERERVARQLRLLYVGRLDETQKRISDVVKIAKRLGEQNVDFTFEIVGDGPEMLRVQAALAGEVESGRVKLHGWLSSGEVISAMRRSQVFILASAYEGFCISLTEAMANGCTPVVSDIKSGNKQLVEDGLSGFVVPVGDVEGFVDRIRLLAEDRERLGSMRVAAWKTGREYSVDRMVDNYVACFVQAIEDARSNPRSPDPDFPLMESCRSKYPLWLRRIKAKIVNR